MKITVLLLFGLLLFTFASNKVFAQYKKLTVILLRHAEKDVSEDADSANPELSAAGKLRAQRLVKVINKYQPDAIYSTDYIRTKATVLPFARKNRAMIFVYDERNLNEMRDLILSGKLKRILIVGHNTTTPSLANLLLKEDKYKALGETEYDKIWVIKIKRNKRKPDRIKDKVITY